VMPHNLYLHSSLVQSRKIDRSKDGMKRAIKFNIIDSTIALNLAFFVNAAILILAGSAFFGNGLFEISEIQDAHKMLEPVLGSKLAPILFAVALIASGQSSTITGTLAGQIIMEGYLNLRIQPWIRRLITRLIAIIPAFIVILVFGDGATGPLLVFSQVLLSLQLGFAIIPLIHFTSDKVKMNGLAIPVYVQVAAWLSALIIVGLNIKMVGDQIFEWLETSNHAWLIWLTVIPAAIGAIALLLYVTISPWIKQHQLNTDLLHAHKKELSTLQIAPFRKIAVAIDFSSLDSKSISTALSQGGKDAQYILIHIVESAGAHMFGGEIADFESEEDKKSLEIYAQTLRDAGYNCIVKIGYGNPKKSISKAVNEEKADLIVMGAHGHRGMKDLFFGTTIEAVRHKVNAAVLVVNQ
jgi:manganese transport protein